MPTRDPATRSANAVAGGLRLVLASASPRRLELLRGLGLRPQVRPAELIEERLPGESPAAMVRRLSQAKARSVASLCSGGGPALVIAADTAVVLGDDVLGKPASASEAAGMLRRLRGRAHEVMTGSYLLRTDDGRGLGAVDTTVVLFRRFDESWIRGYVAGGEPMDKAGAYAIQGGAAAIVESIDGSWSNVVGFPLEPLEQRLASIGLKRSQLVG